MAQIGNGKYLFKLSKSDYKDIFKNLISNGIFYLIVVFGGALGGVIYFFNTDVLYSHFNAFITHNVSLPNVLFFGVFGALLFLFISQIKTFINKSLKTYHYSDYKKDSFKSIMWEWKWINGEAYKLIPLCPKCQAELSLYYTSDVNRMPKKIGRLISKIPSETWGGFFTYTYCHNNDFDNTWFESKDQMYEYVKREIMRKKRTGEYKKAIEKYG